MLAILNALAMDQIYCKATYKIQDSDYEYVQHCPSTDSCFEITKDDFEALTGISDASEVSGSLCYSTQTISGSTDGCS